VGDDALGRLLDAAAHTRQRERRAHQLEKVAPPLRVVPLRGLLGELAMEVLAELRRVAQFAEAAPEQAAVGSGKPRPNGGKIRTHLWHVEQLVNCSAPAILYSLTSRSPRPGSSAGRSYAMLNTWSFGRT